MTATAALPGTPIEELIGGYRAKQISRRRLLTALTAAGASAAAAAALAAAADHATPPAQPLAGAAGRQGAHPAATAAAVDPVQAHAEHVARQVAGTAAPDRAGRAAAVARIMRDYSPRAVVHDPLFGAPLVGAAAIAVHKAAEAAAISDVSLTVLTRAVLGDQLFSTWEMTGVHDGPFYGYPPTGARVKMGGATVQTRDRDGRITSETLYYDAAAMQRQLAGGG
jgi:predicted ester cyclase